MAAESSVFHGSVLRGEAAHVEIGPQANIQDNCIVEGTPGHPARIGARVSLGHNARVFTSVAKLRHLIARGEVRYAFLNTSCGRRAAALNPACAAPARWVRAHGTDVSRPAGLSRGGLLWLLPGASA